MNYTVAWSDEGFEEVSRMIRANPARKAEFALALRTINHRLSGDPANEGESREEDNRVLIARPLTVYYVVDEEDRSVEIGRVVLSG